MIHVSEVSALRGRCARSARSQPETRIVLLGARHARSELPLHELPMPAAVGTIASHLKHLGHRALAIADIRRALVQKGPSGRAAWRHQRNRQVLLFSPVNLPGPGSYLPPRLPLA